jgi:para-nitrobenzyl esterase
MWARATFEQNTHLSTRGPTYFYEFAESSEHDLPIPGPLRSGALHNDDVAYLFGDGAELSPARRGLSGRMIGYWSNFARSGDPNGEGLAAWPRFTGEAPHVQALTAEEIAGTDHVAAHRLGFWASFP